MQFKLLYLPYVALREVLEFFDPIQIIEFSLLSKKVRRLARCPRMCRLMKLRIFDGWCREVNLRFIEPARGITYVFKVLKNDKGMDSNGLVNGRRGEDSENMYLRWLPTFNSYWVDEPNGLLELFKHLSEIFNYPIISDCSMFNNNIPLVQWVSEKFREKVKDWTLRIKNTNATDEDIKSSLDACSSKSENIAFYSKPAPTLQYRFAMDTRHLILQFAQWITFDHLVQLSNQVQIMNLPDTSLTNDDLNRFLRFWLSSRPVFKMYKLQVESYKMNEDEIFFGIPIVPRKNPNVGTRFTAADGQKLWIKGAFDILREDGMNATVSVELGRGDRTGRNTFSMFIWPTNVIVAVGE